MSGRGVLVWLAVALAGSMGIVATGCASTAHRTTCGRIHQEPLDPNYLIHVLPGARGLHYVTDPPTSGAHQPAPHLARVQRRPLPRPVQVGLLEAGDVVVQYRDISRADEIRLRKLAGGHVVVAPNPSLPAGSRVVATAWIYKRTCPGVDPSAIRQFASQRAGHGPGTPPTGP